MVTAVPCCVFPSVSTHGTSFLLATTTCHTKYLNHPVGRTVGRWTLDLNASKNNSGAWTSLANSLNLKKAWKAHKNLWGSSTWTQNKGVKMQPMHREGDGRGMEVGIWTMGVLHVFPLLLCCHFLIPNPSLSCSEERVIKFLLPLLLVGFLMNYWKHQHLSGDEGTWLFQKC